MTGNCTCGAVKISLTVKPSFINDCDCSLCRPAGVWWGYFATGEVEVSGKTKQYRREDRSNPAVSVHFCGNCGNSTHWTLLPQINSDLMGVNMRLFPINTLNGIELRFPDGAGWDGTSPYGFRRKAIRLDGISH